jgi:catechol 2,3-dioxygenase-like lactoylglutathione lyase family enzyme
VAFFATLGLELQGEAPVEGDWVDRVVGLESVRAQIAMLRTPDGHGRIELTKFHTPSTDGGYQRAAANASGIRHVAFAVDDIDAVLARLRARGAELVGDLGCYEDSYRLCYVRGPRGSHHRAGGADWLTDQHAASGKGDPQGETHHGTRFDALRT